MKNLQTLLIILTAALFFTACEKDETFSLWTISGEVVQQDSQTPEIASPLEGIKVYLFNFPFTIDTTTSWFSREGILDSALTDKNGLYNFKLVAPGDYFVFPGDTTKSYDFSWEESSDSILLARGNSKSDYKINFSALQTVPDNSNNGFIFIFDSSSIPDAVAGVIVIYRKARTWESYWDWGPKIRWGEWYYSGVNSATFYSKNIQRYDRALQTLTEAQDASTWLYQYKDEFIIKFYKTTMSNSIWMLKPSKTVAISGDDFSVESNNSNKRCKYKVDWYQMVVNRID